MKILQYTVGIAILYVCAVSARALSSMTGAHHLLLAIAIGFIFANTTGVPNSAKKGISTHKLWLASGIILMGASLTIDTIFELGPTIVVIIAVISVSIVVTEILSRKIFSLDDRLGSLLAAGASICGVSAVIAVAGAIEARQQQIAYAAATILFFDAITIVAYPIIGELLGLTGKIFGIWVGISMFSTGPVVAVGFMHSDVAGQWATITKISRNAFIGVIVLVYAVYYTQPSNGDSVSLKTVWDEFPKFVIGFLAFMIIASLGILSSAQTTSIENTYNWLFLLAFVGLGTEIKVKSFRQTGITPILLVLITLFVVSLLSLSILLVLFQ